MKAAADMPGESLRDVEAPPHKSVFAPMTVPMIAKPTPLIDIRIELQGGANVTVIWPATATGECAAWMRKLLRWVTSTPSGS